MQVVITILILTLLVLPGISCNRQPREPNKVIHEPGTEQVPSTPEPVILDDVTIGAEDPDNTVSYGDSTEAPDGWPAFLPDYPGGRIVSSQRTSGGGQLSLMLGFECQDSPQVVYEFYVTRIKAEGYSLTKDIDDGKFLLSEFERGGTILQIQTAREKLRTMTFLTLAIPE